MPLQSLLALFWCIIERGEVSIEDPQTDNHLHSKCAPGDSPNPCRSIKQPSRAGDEGAGSVAVRLPLANKPGGPAPAATSIPHAMCYLFIENAVDGEICYELFDVGIGRMCFAPALHHYGEFPPWPSRQLA